ncbi:MAG: fumarylacetoacetate hydrolase family protein [Desulfosarcina sp.]|jgi:2-keto-4-pentenoate hydratase/2-oxohepta-3-ene-1,7-dioic acid hydratase in catechol pathway
MRLATITIDGSRHLAICTPSGCVPVRSLINVPDSQCLTHMAGIIESGGIVGLNDWFRREGRSELKGMPELFLEETQWAYAPLYRKPSKIWGIGLNYQEHAKDLSERSPTSAPASFMKPYTTIIGHGDTIVIPKLSQKTTAEAELGIIIGKRCKDVSRENWLDVVAGFTTILDVTAEDILQQNPRYLTMSKSFDTFFAFGPQLVTPDEIGNVERLSVATVINGTVHAENTVNHMTFTPDRLVAYHSQVMTLLPGDIISTGTPGAVHIQHGDTVECRIPGFETLKNPVVDAKVFKDNGQ